MSSRLAACLAALLLIAACATAKPTSAPPASGRSRDLVVLLPDEHGKTGAILVSGAGGERLLTKPREAVEVAGDAPPGDPFSMPEREVIALVGPALKALPKPPAQFILYFRHNSAELTDASRAQLPSVYRTIRERAPVDISVVGHTDTVGERQYNHRLSLQRARAVAALLAAKGVEPSILDVTSHGKDNPLIPTGDQVPEPRNRRVEVTVR